MEFRQDHIICCKVKQAGVGLGLGLESEKDVY